MFHKAPAKAPAILPSIPRIIPNKNPAGVDDAVHHFRAVPEAADLHFLDLVRIHRPKNRMDRPDLDGRVGVKAIIVVESPVGSGVDLEVVVDKPSQSQDSPFFIFSFLPTNVPPPIPGARFLFF